MNNLEVEIAELQKMIEAKRDQLEKEGGIVEEKELVRQSVKEMFLDKAVPSTAPQTNTAQTTAVANQTAISAGQTVPSNGSYLDYLDPQTTEIINNLIGEIQSKGITPVIDEVAGQEPFVVDAFHDALVDKLYDELKARGLVK
ncbi:MAG: hypothetical protein WC640_03260 [Candidatus Paceibacterota bacterium]|jgi:hypothetical protein